MKYGKEESIKLKGIAIILMLLHHMFNGGWMYESYNISFFPLNEVIVNNLAWFGKNCVSIFAFISAYGLSEKYKVDYNPRECIFKIYKNYWFVYLLAIVITSILNNYFIEIFIHPYGVIFGCGYFVLDFLGLSGLLGTPSFNGSWWYVSLALVIIFSVPIIVELIKKLGRSVTGFIVIILPIIYGIQFQGNNAVLSFMPVVFAGVLFSYDDIFTKLVVNRFIEHVILVIFMCGSIVLYLRLPVEKYYYVNYGVVPLILIIFSVRYIITIPVLKRVLTVLGRNSMNIFYVHIFIRSIYLEKFVYSFGNWFICMGVLLILSLVTSVVIEKIKKIVLYDKNFDKLLIFLKRQIFDKM